MDGGQKGRTLRNLFSGYYLPTESDFQQLWSDAIFVFDTNVLLNLYSYPEDVRNVFFSVLGKLEDRIWVPYQVGLEFHRNRFSRIKQANQRVEKLLLMIRNNGEQLANEVKSIELEKRNIGISDIHDRLKAVQDAHAALSDAVQLACDKLPPISLNDPIGEQICQLLEGRVGLPPAVQDELDKLVADAQERFDKKIPPGFADADKGEEIFRDGGITYQRKFGDLILWRQLLNHADQHTIKKVVFVTGDKKKDWWLTEDGKTLGPLPELVQEIKASSPVELFWMYSADQFLQNAEKHLKATEVTPEAVEQVKESLSIKIETAPPNLVIRHGESHYEDLLKRILEQANDSRPDVYRGGLLNYFSTSSVEETVQSWLRESNPGCEIIRTKGFPDIIVDTSGKLSGYEVKQLRNFSPRAFPPSVVNSLLRGYLEVNEGRIHDFSLILVLSADEGEFFREQEGREELARRGSSLIEKYPAHSIIFGISAEDVFEPLLIIQGE